jgi:transposase
MDDKQFCKEIMGIVEPWVITKIVTNKKMKRVDVYLDYPPLVDGKCPVCGMKTPLHDKREERIWRHLDSCEYRTFLHCRTPRSKCPEHGVKTMDVPWAENMSHFTRSFERRVIDEYKATKNISKTARMFGLSWDEISGIEQRAVKRGIERRKLDSIKYTGIDEKSFLKGQNYVSILTDGSGRRVLEVVQNRDTKAAKALFGCLSGEQKGKIKAVSMDFLDAYISATREECPGAQIVHDKFHIVKYIHEAVNKVRSSEHKWRKKQKDEALTGTKYLWLKKLENFTDKDKQRWAELKLDQLEVGKAWNMKELFMHFWESPNKRGARKFFNSWYYSVTHSGLEPMIKAAKTIKVHLENILTWWKHPISNSYAEGINSVIQEIKVVARGFRNFDNYRNAILFHCGALDMYP